MFYRNQKSWSFLIMYEKQFMLTRRANDIDFIQKSFSLSKMLAQINVQLQLVKIMTSFMNHSPRQISHDFGSDA